MLFLVLGLIVSGCYNAAALIGLRVVVLQQRFLDIGERHHGFGSIGEPESDLPVVGHGHNHRAIFHGVNNRFHIFWDRPWRDGEVRRSQFVFIGKKLDEAKIEKGLRACLA